MTDAEKAEFKAKMAAAKAAKTSTPPTTSPGTSARTVTRGAKTQREIDLEKHNSTLQDENGRLKSEKSELEKWIEKFSKPSRRTPAAATAAAGDDGGWEAFSQNPW
jgi:septal ring factor EnvC (AmiA/AmiB activator)